MNTTADIDLVDTCCECPTCGHCLPDQRALFPFDDPCPGCGALPWCCVAREQDTLLLAMWPKRTPTLEELDRLMERHVRPGAAGRVICDLSALDCIDSLQVARLISLQQRVRSAAARLRLRGMRPLVRQVFSQLKLQRILLIEDDTSDCRWLEESYE